MTPPSTRPAPSTTRWTPSLRLPPAVEAGVVPDREALLMQHPRWPAACADFFADYDRLDRQGRRTASVR